MFKSGTSTPTQPPTSTSSPSHNADRRSYQSHEQELERTRSALVRNDVGGCEVGAAIGGRGPPRHSSSPPTRNSAPCPDRLADPFNINPSERQSPTHPANIPHPSHTTPRRTPLTESRSHTEQPICGSCRTRTCDLVIRSTQDNPAPVRVVRCIPGSIPRISRAPSNVHQHTPTSAKLSVHLQHRPLRECSFA